MKLLWTIIAYRLRRWDPPIKCFPVDLNRLLANQLENKRESPVSSTFRSFGPATIPSSNKFPQIPLPHLAGTSLAGGAAAFAFSSQAIQQRRAAHSTTGPMRKIMHVVVVGGRKVGKTALLQQLARYHDITAEVRSRFN
jgi:hypothetical protein